MAPPWWCWMIQEVDESVTSGWSGICQVHVPLQKQGEPRKKKNGVPYLLIESWLFNFPGSWHVHGFLGYHPHLNYVGFHPQQIPLNNKKPGPLFIIAQLDGLFNTLTVILRGTWNSQSMADSQPDSPSISLRKTKLPGKPRNSYHFFRQRDGWF